MNDGYITEVTYPDACHPFMAPVWLNYVAMRNGFAPRPLVPGFTYLDLGCGFGMTVSALAACYPQGRFIGLDLNADHIAPGKRRAERAGIANLDLIEGDFATLADDAVPLLDFAVLHGFYSWVGPEVRKRAIEFLARKVKPGGIVLASYNALPGWASIAPLRALMQAYVANIQGGALEKAEAARRWLATLKASGATFFREHPEAAREVEAMQTADLNYIVHEYFHRDWGLFYVTEVAADFARAGLAFAGSLPSAMNDPALALPEDLRANAPLDRLGLELLKDFANNERLRIDIFVRSDAPPLEGALRAMHYGDSVVGTTSAMPTRVVDLGIGDRVLRVDHRAGPAAALFASIAQAPRSFLDLKKSPGAPADRADLLAAIDSLIDGCRFRPFAATAQALAPAPARIALPSGWNRLIVGEANGARPGPLASPVVGDAIALEGFALLALRAYAEAGLDGAPARAAAIFKTTGEGLVRDGVAVDPAEAEASVAAETARLLVAEAPRLVQLGVIAPA